MRAPAPLQPISAWARLLLGIACFALVLGAWMLATETGLVSRTILSSPAATARAGWALFSEQDFALDVALTVARVLAGFAIAAAVAIPLGVAMGAYRPLNAFLGPFLTFARYLPAAGFVPLLILWAGIGEAQKLAMIFIVCFFQAVLMITAAVLGTPRPVIEVAYTLGSRGLRTLRRVLLPSAAPQIAEILRQVLAWAWSYVIFAELIGSSRGIGHMITDSQSLLATDQMVFGLIALGVIALVVDIVFRGINRRVFRWSGI